MSMTMNCFVMPGIGKVGMVEKPIPRVGPNDAIVRTTAALICTSDTHTVAARSRTSAITATATAYRSRAKRGASA